MQINFNYCVSTVCSPFAHHLFTWRLLLAIQSPVKTTEVTRQTILYYSPIQKAQIRLSQLSSWRVSAWQRYIPFPFSLFPLSVFSNCPQLPDASEMIVLPCGRFGNSEIHALPLIRRTFSPEIPTHVKKTAVLVISKIKTNLLFTSLATTLY